ncbi:MAG: MucBP domain-containing protein [Clostridiales bacterium]|nr:MucBP domain-containing protein [Clostridiales bacterium]
MTKRLLSIALALLMVLAIVPLGALAKTADGFAAKRGNVRSTYAWVPTDEIVVGTEYLIGFKVAGKVYLIMNYNPSTSVSNHYYYNKSSTYYGYTAEAVLDGENITGVTGWTDDIGYCKWTFSSTTGGTISSVSDNNYHLSIYSSTSYDDCCPYNSSSYAYTNWVWDSANHQLTYSGTSWGGSTFVKYASYVASLDSYSNFCAAPTSASENSYVQLYSYQEIADPEPTAEPTVAPTEAPTNVRPLSSVTYSVETKDITNPAVGDEFQMDFSISANSCLKSGRYTIEFNHDYLECIAVTGSFEGSVMNAINASWDDEENPTSDRLHVEGNASYQGGEGQAPLGQEGHYYTIIAMGTTTFNYDGLQAGGKVARMTYKFTAVPEENMTLPLTIEVYDSFTDTDAVPVLSHATIVKEDGAVNVIIDTTQPTAEPTVEPTAEPTVAPTAVPAHDVTYTGETVTEDQPAVDGTFYWTLSVSENSGLFSGHWLVDYDEDYLECTAYSDTWSGGLFSAINAAWDNGSAISDKPKFPTNIAYVGGTGGSPVGEANNLYANIGCYLTSFDHYGVNDAGAMVRLTFKWKAIPDDSALMTDENGSYLPVPVTIIESKYMIMTEAGAASVEHTNPQKVDGKIYITKAVQYTLDITYQYADGTQAADPVHETHEAGYAYSVTSPTITGYTADPAVVAGTLDGNTTVIVTYTKNVYTITWKMDDGTVIETTMVEYGDMPAHAAPTKPATAQYTYVFAGWSPALAVVTEDATYTATFTQTVNSYTITWIIDGVPETEQYEYGEMPTHAAPVKEGYTFVGWDPQLAAVTGNATYTAVFEKTGYKIIVHDYTNGYTAQTGKATTSIVAEQLYSGEVTFTVSIPNDTPCVVAIENADGTYTRLPCATAEGVHSFTVTVSDADVNVVIALKGDVDLNGRVNGNDGRFILRYDIEMETLSINEKLQKLVGDVTGDGKLNGNDGRFILRYDIELETIVW